MQVPGEHLAHRHATNVEVVIEALQPALRGAEVGERAAHRRVIACTGLCEQRLSFTDGVVSNRSTYWLFGFQRGVMVASRSQLGLPA